MQINFDARQYDPTQSMNVALPLDDYWFEITGAEVEKVKGKENEGKLTVSLRIADGPFKGVVQKDYFNLYNLNPTAVQIAYKELAALCFVVNKPTLVNETDLIGGRGRVKIGPQLNNDKYSEVKQYMYGDGSVPGPNGVPQGGPQVAPVAPAPVQQAFPTQPAPQAPLAPQNPFQAPAAPAQPQFGAPASNPFGSAPASPAPAGNPPWAT